MNSILFNRILIPSFLATFLSFQAFADNPAATIKVHDSEDNYRLGVAGVAQNYLGIPYVLGARGPRSFDCSGFTSYIFNEFGAKMYPLAATQSQEGFSTDLQTVRAGDLVFFGKGSNISHVAMVVRRDAEGITVVHCTTSRGVVVENITKSHYWSPKIRLARNVISRFFEFVPKENNIFNSLAAPLLAQVETVQQKVEQAAVAVTQNLTAAANLASASISKAVQKTESNSNVYSLEYKADRVHNAYSRTYGHVSSDEDDADADNDEGGQN